jgi:hypothetical protein
VGVLFCLFLGPDNTSSPPDDVLAFFFLCLSDCDEVLNLI